MDKLNLFGGIFLISREPANFLDDKRVVVEAYL